MKDHIIFKLCTKWNFDTSSRLNRPHYRGLSICPACNQETSEFACTECHLKSAVDCPLTQLLGKQGQASETAEEGSRRDAPDTNIPAAPQEPLKQKTCEQCYQARCQTCKPEFMNLIVDMIDYSKTFADGMTLAESWK
ncbi:hypothetical protein DL98DRAFT_587906 [Cadophora sp. DSE1049]|nr:hypothetical protein DL98DRAFT_587906 [Cadophora sp. DSE1049]